MKLYWINSGRKCSFLKSAKKGTTSPDFAKKSTEKPQKNADFRKWHFGCTKLYEVVRNCTKLCEIVRNCTDCAKLYEAVRKINFVQLKPPV